MMNSTDSHEEVISKHRLVSLDPELKQQVLCEAKSTWDTEVEVSWWIPVLRFAACLAFATLIITVTSGAPPQPIAERRSQQQPSIDSFPEMVGIYERMNVSAFPNRDTIQLFLEHQRVLRELLSDRFDEEMQGE